MYQIYYYFYPSPQVLLTSALQVLSVATPHYPTTVHRTPLTATDCPPVTGATRSEATEGVDNPPLTAPSYYVLDKTKIQETFGLDIPYWTDSLRQCIANLIRTEK